MADVKIQEQYRDGDRVNVKDLISGYDRYVDASAWDSDPIAVAADIALYLDAAAKEREDVQPPQSSEVIELSDRQARDVVNQQ